MPDEISLRAPDPDSLGKIRNIVRTAHKWGGDGRKPLFRKIRRVLLAKHPEVIAKAFGGNADTAAAWIKNNWFRQMKGKEPPPTRGRKKVSASMEASFDRSYVEAPREFFEHGAELFCATDKVEEGKDGLIWATALRTGEWRVNPVPGAVGPLQVDKSFMEEVMQAWNEGAWEHVTVPTYHTDDDVLANTGFVRDLRVVQDPNRSGEYLLRAALEFTEDDVKQKVLKGSIAGLSVNVKFNIRHQESGKTYPKVLTHICLTNIPFINGLDAFKRKLAAEKELEPEKGELLFSYVHEDDEGDLPDMSFMADLKLGNGDIWDESEDFTYVRQKLAAQVMKGYFLDPEGDLVDPSGVDTNGEKEDVDKLTPAYVSVQGMTPDKVLVCAWAKSGSDGDYSYVGDTNGSLQGWVFGYEVDVEGQVVVDPIDEWSKVEKMWVELSREFQIFPDSELAAKFVPEDKPQKKKKGSGVTQEALPGITVRLTDTPRGGDTVADETKDKGTEEDTPKEVTLTREDLDRIADERADAKLAAYREEQEERQKEKDAELAATRRKLHEMSVKERVVELTAKGHAPSVVKKAKEIMLADVQQAEAVSFTRKEGEGADAKDVEVKLSATQIVEEVLDSIPATALTNTDAAASHNVGNGGGDDTKDAKTRANELYDSLYGEDVEAVITEN